MSDPPFTVNLDLRGFKVNLPDDPTLLVEPNYSVFRHGVEQRFDGSVDSHDKLLSYNALVQSVDKVFQDNVKRALALPGREAQIEALMEYTDKPLAPRHIAQIGQELSLRSATNDVITFLDAQKLLSAENGTTAFFQSPEVMQWRATELQKAGRHEEAARLGAGIIDTPDNARNPEALRTIAMAEVALAAGGGREGALKAFEAGFAKTGDYSLGMGALNAALEMGDMAQARQIAPLVTLAAKNVGADQSKSFWPALVNAQAAIVSGDEAETGRALRQLSSVLAAKNENGTPVASDADKAAALQRIAEIGGAQGAETQQLLKPLADQLQGAAPPAPPSGPRDVDDTFRQRGYTSRQAMTPEGFHIRGNVRGGGMLPDSSTTLRDKMQFLEVAKTPLAQLVQSGVIAAADLPQGVDMSKSLYDIDNVQTRIQASQAVARGIFDVDGRNLEDLHGIDHKIYDSVVRLRITHAGATSVGHFEGDEFATYQQIKDDKALVAAIRKGDLTPEQRGVLDGLPLTTEPGVDPVAAAQRLVARGDVLLATDTRTNLAVAAAEGIGDCRHVAAATEALVSAVQQDKTAVLIRQAAESLNSGDVENYNRLTQAANTELNGYEMRIYDQEVRAAVEVPDKYNPLMTKDGKFVAAADGKPQTIETHMHNVVRFAGDGGPAKYVVADSFYQKGPYRMGWVENSAPEVFVPPPKDEKDRPLDLLRLSGGEVEAVIVERDANGKVIMGPDGYPVPVLGEDGQPKTVRTPIELQSTKYSSPDRLQVGAPGPENRLNGTTREAGAPDLAARLLDADRRADYVAQAEFIVRNPTKVDTPELAKPSLMAEAEARVTAQAEELRTKAPLKPVVPEAPQLPRDVIERYAAGNAVVETYLTSGVDVRDGKVVPNAGQADTYAVVTTKTPIDEAGLGRIMDSLSDRGNATAGGDYDKDSTGSLAAITQKQAKQPGMASFDLVAGLRGDSTTLIASVDANNNVSIYDVNGKELKAPASMKGATGFGEGAQRGGNFMLTKSIDIPAGEKAFVINISDGVIDGYTKSPARGEGDTRKSFQEALGIELEAHLKSNPETADISRFLSERATALGSKDNTTAAVLRLDTNTDLQGKSVLLAVFDGVGHEVGAGDVSDALAKHLPEAVPGAEPVKLVARAELDHIATRDVDLARAKNPAAVFKPDAKPEIKPAAEPAAKPAAAKPAPPKNDSDGDAGGAAPRKTPPKADAAPPKAAAPPKPTPKPEAPEPRKAAAPQAGSGGGAAKPGVVSRIGGVRTKLDRHGGHATSGASIALQLAQGDVKGATVSALTDVALSPKTYKAVASFTRKVAPLAKAAGFVSRKIPVVGSVVSFGYGAYNVGSHLYKGEYGKAGAEAVATVAETAAGFFGFGAGDAAREAVRELTVRTVGEKYAPEKSSIRQLGEAAVGLLQQQLDKPKPAPVKPSIYHFKTLPAVAYVLKSTPTQAIDGKLSRTPDGHIKNLREVDFTNPKNLKAFEDAIHRKLKKDDDLIKAGKPVLQIAAVTSFFGGRLNTREIEDAKKEAAQLRRALREIELFKREVREFKGGPAPGQSQFHAGHARGAAAAGGAAPEKRPAAPRPPAPKP
ncbi:MAG: hypothetical protein ACAH80_06320 [Alphaproteobacteria bacterium]